MYQEINVSIVIAADLAPVEHTLLESLRPPFKKPGNISQASTIAKYEAEYPQKWVDDAMERTHTTSLRAMHLIAYVGDQKVVDGPAQSVTQMLDTMRLLTTHTRDHLRLAVRWMGEDTKLSQKNLLFQAARRGLLTRAAGKLAGEVDHRLFYGSKHFSLRSLLEVDKEPNVSMSYAIGRLLPDWLPSATESITGNLDKDVKLIERCFIAAGELPINSVMLEPVTKKIVRKVLKTVKGN